MKLSIRMLKFSVTLFCCAIALSQTAVSAEKIYIERVSDPLALPYHFDVLDKMVFFTSETHAPSTGAMIPMGLSKTGSTGVILTTDSWRIRDSLTCIVSYSELQHQNAISHVNIKASRLVNHVPCDLNGDGRLELVITYSSKDTAFVEILDIEEGIIYSRPVSTGTDLDSSGSWDGETMWLTGYDFNGDGFDELLLCANAGYDLYPRKAVCLDWHNDELLWEFPIAGSLNRIATPIGVCDQTGDIIVLLSIVSKGNSAVEGDMDDRHSYIVLLDANGKLIWKMETGGIFSNSYGTIIDYDGSGCPEVLAAFKIEPVDALDDDRTARHWSVLRVVDVEGNQLDSVSFAPDRVVRRIELDDIDGDGIDEIQMSLSDNSIEMYEQNLQPIASIQSYTEMSMWKSGDFIGNGTNQHIVYSNDDRTWLLDEDFEPIAQFPARLSEVESYIYDSDENPQRQEMILSTSMGGTALRLAVRKSAWGLIFYRKPWLAFLSAFLPMAIVVAVVTVFLQKIRTKNRQISKARDELNDTLSELKLTQNKLIVAERYKEAKDIAGGFAHEIRNALFPARTAMSRLSGARKGAAFEPDKIARSVEVTNESVARAIGLTNLISRYTRIDSQYEPEKVRISDTVQRVIADNSIAIEDLGVEVRIEGDSDTEVISNRDQFHIAMNNLLLNSLDALDSKPSPRIEIRWAAVNKHIEITFADNGIGIEAEVLSRVFDTFYSTKPDKGTGVGLALVRKIIDMYGGTISVSSDPGQVTEFRIRTKSEESRNSS